MLLETSLLIYLFIIALATGFLKAGLPVLGSFIALLLALAFPTKHAVGIALIYLLAGDIVALYMHWRSANWSLLKRMLPAIFVGIAIGSIALMHLSNQALGLSIGILLIFLVALEPFRDQVTAWAYRRERTVRVISGVLAGTTTVVNIAGGVLSLYFLLLKIDKHSFVGTSVLFFAIVNVVKLPIYIAIGDIFVTDYFLSIAITLPLVLVGAYLGGRFLHWLPQKVFNIITVVFIGIGSAMLTINNL